MKTADIAVELGIKPATVRRYIHNIAQKAGISSRFSLGMWYSSLITEDSEDGNDSNPAGAR